MWLETFQKMSQETQGFILVILIFNIYFHLRFTPENAHKAPAFLTTLGILGTFVGIAIGLWDFDPDNVNKSVPKLIEGIKTAVWASAWGIFCALTVKFRDIVSFRKKASPKRVSNATIDTLADILKAVEQSLAHIDQSLVNIEFSLVGDDDISLRNQIKVTRRDHTELLTRLNQSLDGFCEKVAESNTKALVQALTEIIRDFNVKLNEQFGDNFKQLNQASEKMLEWQKNYGQQMSTVIDQQTIASKNMAESSERYQSLVEKAEVFTTTANQMSALLTGLETQRNHIEESMISLATLINTASTGLPQIEKQILEITHQIGNGMKATNEEFNVNMKRIIEKTKEQVMVLDTALSEELTKSLESFGKQLAALSQKFAQDYGPITERLQAVLNIAR